MRHRHLSTSLSLVLAAVGCGGASIQPDAAPDSAVLDPDAAPVDDGESTVGCASDTSLCLYQPSPLPIQLVQLKLTDATRVGGPREIPIAVRFSKLAPKPLPVVIWSHGGANGQTDPVTAMDKWAIAAAEAGYFSVSIAHEPRDQASRDALCASLGFDTAGCATFKFLSFDRPHDISVVLDKLVDLASTPQFTNAIDLTKIAVGGHSAGAGGTLMVAGAARSINGVSTVIADPRPIAFLAFSPQAPGSDGMSASGYALVSRPTLIGTGRGDDDPPDTADGRSSVYDLIQPGNKARIFVEDIAALHTLYALETETCAVHAPLAHCEEMRDWVKSAGLAFLDANVRGLPDAIAWVASTNLATASNGAAIWSTR